VSLKDLNLRHLNLISRYSSRHAIRGGTGIVFAILVFSSGLLIAHLMLQPMEMMKQQSRNQSGYEMNDKQAMNVVIQIARPVVGWAINEGADKEKSQIRTEPQSDKYFDWPSYLLDKKPALLSAIFLIMIFIAPFLVALGAFNQFSGDVQSRGLRYQLFRTERTNIFFGRFVGAVIFAFILMAFIIGIIALYLGLKVNLYEGTALIGWSLRGVFALWIVCLPYIALCSLISAMIDSPFGSLTISSLIISCVPFFAFIAKTQWEPAGVIKYALPWGVQSYLLHYNPLVVAGAVAACLGYTVVFLLLGHLHFCKRDL
jgi:ABC-type transport system involved in multi-copper enzyme maturation permease subunit